MLRGMSATITSNPPFPAVETVAAVYPGTYHLTDLGESPEGLPLLPVALNDAGQVALYGHPPERQTKLGQVRGFLREGITLHEHLATFGGVPLAGLSANGLICGQERAGPGPLRAWAKHLGNIGATHWPEVESGAMAVNTRGDTAGYVAFEADGRVRRRVFLVNARNEARFLPAPNGSSAIPSAINEAGAVLINSATGFYEFNSQALIWRNGVCTPIAGLDGGGIWGAALTPEGRVAGRLFTTLGGIRAFLHENGCTYDLNRGRGFQSEALALNDQRVVVGRLLGLDGQRQAFRWTPADGMRLLSELVPRVSGWALQKAVAINASGQIAGTGQFNQAPRGFLLTPVG